MISSVLSALLAVLQTIAPTATEAAIVQIITALTNIIPFLVSEYQALKPIVLNIITALKGNDAITTDQVTQLQTMQVNIDAAFEAAALAAQAQDATLDPSHPNAATDDTSATLDPSHPNAA